MRKLIEKLGNAIEGDGQVEDGAEDSVSSVPNVMRKGLVEELGDAIDGKPQDESTDANTVDAAASLAEASNLLDEEAKTEGAIKALRDTDYRDQDAFFKMVQLLKGLATVTKEDEQAKKYMAAVSDALTTAAKKVLGEDADGLDEAKRKSQGEIRIFSIEGYGQPEKYEYSVKERQDSGKTALADRGSAPTARKAFDKAFKVCKDDYGWE